MFLLDSLLINGISFVLDKVATIADAEINEINDPERQRERLLEAQMKLEAGELTDEEFGAIEADVFERLREIRARTEGQDVVVDDEHRVTGVEITVDDDV